VGNPDRGDDGVGRLVARLLSGRLPAGVRVEQVGGGAADLIELLREADQVILADAMVSGAPVGTVRRMDCASVLPGLGGTSSHGLGVAEAVGLARALGCLPSVCVVFGVEAAGFAPGAAMSAEVVAAAGRAAEQIVGEFSS
jgi:hydrogenase maturation protease